MKRFLENNQDAKPKIVLAFDHGGVLDGAACDVWEEKQYIDPTKDIILGRTGYYSGTTTYLKDGIQILQLLSRLAQAGCIITSHSANNLEDQLHIYQQLIQAAKSNNIHFSYDVLGMHAIFDKKCGYSLQEPFFEHKTLETYTFGGDEGKAGVRKILKDLYVLDNHPQHLFVFDDAPSEIQVAQNEGCNTFLINGDGISLLQALEQAELQVNAIYAKAGMQEQELSEQTIKCIEDLCQENEGLEVLSEMIANLETAKVDEIISKSTILFDILESSNDEKSKEYLTLFMNHVSHPKETLKNTLNNKKMTLEDVASCKEYAKTTLYLRDIRKG